MFVEYENLLSYLFLDTIQLENSESTEYIFFLLNLVYLWQHNREAHPNFHSCFSTCAKLFPRLNLLFLVSVPLSLHTMFRIFNKSLFPLTRWLTLFTALLLKIPLPRPYFCQLLNWNSFHFICTTKDKLRILKYFERYQFI